MQASRVLASATLLALAGGYAGAAEIIGGFVDMRLGGGISGGDYDLSVSDNDPPAFNQDASDSFDDNYRVTLSWVGSLGLRSYGGWLWGIGATYNYHSGTQITYRDEVPESGAAGEFTNDADLHAWSANGFIGYAVPFGEHFQLELLPFIGAGRAYLKTPESNGHLNTAADSYLETGVNLDAVYTFGNGFQFGATIGYMHWETSLLHDNIEAEAAIDGDSARFNFSSETYIATVFIGVRL
jgi:hypothetical protein